MKRTAAVVVVGAAVLVGCGGGGNSRGSRATSTTSSRTSGSDVVVILAGLIRPNDPWMDRWGNALPVLERVVESTFDAYRAWCAETPRQQAGNPDGCPASPGFPHHECEVLPLEWGSSSRSSAHGAHDKTTWAFSPAGVCSARLIPCSACSAPSPSHMAGGRSTVTPSAGGAEKATAASAPTRTITNRLTVFSFRSSSERTVGTLSYSEESDSLAYRRRARPCRASAHIRAPRRRFAGLGRGARGAARRVPASVAGAARRRRVRRRGSFS